MFPYTLTLLRHGEIDHQQRLIGATDLPLTPLGHAQLAASWAELASSPVSSIACSPLKRCREFAVQQALASSVPLHVEARLAEMDFGAWEAQPLAELASSHPNWRAQLQRGALIPPGGEALDAFRQRVLDGFAAWQSHAQGSHRVLVGHGGVIAVLLAELLGIELAAAQLIAVPRGGFAQLALLDGHPAYLTRLTGAPCAD